MVAACLRIAGQVCPGGATLSSDATLSGLALKDGSTAIELTPSTFVATTKSYTASVANAVDEITIVPTVNDGTAMYQIQNSGGTALVDADSNADDFQVDLAVGANTIKVEVTAEDGTTDTYTVVVTRAAATTVTISADKMSAVFKEDDIEFTVTRTGSTTAALSVSVALTQTKNFLATSNLTKTVTIGAGQSTADLHDIRFRFPAFRDGNEGRGRNADRDGAGHPRLRPGDAVLGRCGHRHRGHDPVRYGGLPSGRGGRDPHGQADRAHGPGRAPTDLQFVVPIFHAVRQRPRKHRLCGY